MSDRWEDAGLSEVLLPSGRRVRGRLPDLLDLARRGAIPTDLLAWVLKSADPKWLADPEPDPDVDESKVQGYLDELVVLFVRQVQDGDAWVDYRLDPDRLPHMPPGERFTLEIVAAMRMTPEAASMRSALIMGGADPDALEVDDGVSRLGPFRGGDDGTPAGDDSAGVGHDAEPLHRAPRRRRVPRGRGAGEPGHDRVAEGSSEATTVGDAAR